MASHEREGLRGVGARPGRNTSTGGRRSRSCRHRRHPLARSRRDVVAALAVAAVGALAGCLGGEADGSTEPPEPVALDGGRTCDACGMVIADHYGPNAQVFYGDGYPEDRDGPLWYDSVAEMLTDTASHVRRGNEPVAVFVTDYAAVDYAVTERDDDRLLSSHVAAESFIDAEAAAYVVDSGVLGAMGPEPIPFGEGDDATAFVDAEGGRIVEYDDLHPELGR